MALFSPASLSSRLFAVCSIAAQLRQTYASCPPHGVEGNVVLGGGGGVIKSCWCSWALYGTDQSCCQLYYLLAGLCCCPGQALPAGRGDASVTTSLRGCFLK